MVMIDADYVVRWARTTWPGGRCHRLSYALALAAALAPAGAGAAEPDGHPLSIPRSTRSTVESLSLPGGEHLGLLGLSLLFEGAPGWWAGPAVYGAVRGDRGGLFVGGVEAQRRWTFGRNRLAAGLFAGGGGGADAPVGDGLMLRPSLTLTRDFGGFEAGLGWSRVVFPSGDIQGSQMALVLGWDGRFRYTQPARAGQPSIDHQRSGLGIDRVHATVGQWRLQDDGPGDRTLGLVGARFERALGAGGGFASVEGAGAASGDGAGYMEILAGAGWRLGGHHGVQFGARAAFGLGGGGSVPTGGGLIGRLALDLSAPISRGWRAGVELAAVGSAEGGTRGPAWQGWFAADIDAAAPPYAGHGRVARHEWLVVLQDAGDVERKDGPSAPMQTIGFKWNRDLGPTAYLSAQAHAAFGGDAGAYGSGLVGLGARWRPDLGGARPWQAGFEALVGAGGGGGVRTEGGALAQVMAWAAIGGNDAGEGGQWRMGLGAQRSLQGGMTSPLIELAWGRAFGHGGP
jgi:hypothetical protein